MIGDPLVHTFRSPYMACHYGDDRHPGFMKCSTCDLQPHCDLGIHWADRVAFNKIIQDMIKNKIPGYEDYRFDFALGMYVLKKKEKKKKPLTFSDAIDQWKQLGKKIFSFLKYHLWD